MRAITAASPSGVEASALIFATMRWMRSSCVSLALTGWTTVVEVVVGASAARAAGGVRTSARRRAVAAVGFMLSSLAGSKRAGARAARSERSDSSPAPGSAQEGHLARRDGVVRVDAQEVDAARSGLTALVPAVPRDRVRARLANGVEHRADQLALRVEDPGANPPLRVDLE